MHGTDEETTMYSKMLSANESVEAGTSPSPRPSTPAPVPSAQGDDVSAPAWKSGGAHASPAPPVLDASAVRAQMVAQITRLMAAGALADKRFPDAGLLPRVAP